MYPVSVMHGDYNSNAPFASGIHDLYLQAWWGAEATVGIDNWWNCSDFPSEENTWGQNGAYVCNERVDELWDSIFVSMDPEERQAAADEIQYIFADQALTLWLFDIAQVTVTNSRLEWESHLSSDYSPWLTIEDWKFTD
jgi:ABC-type transport system substrate-binding protein